MGDLKWDALGLTLGAPPPTPIPLPGVRSWDRLFSATTLSDFSNTFHSLIVLSFVDNR